MYYDRLMEKVRERGLERHFVLHKGFRAESVLLSYMSQSQVNLFPYWNHPEWMVHGASGAVRLALASGTPTVVGDVPFFSEFKGHIPVCNTIEEYVVTISRLFEDPAYKEEVRQSTSKFIADRTWDKIAQWYLQVKPHKELVAL
jgi:glycosyltransferase involved in cell wall biosynthesis